MSSNLDADKSTWFHDVIAWETEGARTPAQPDIQIRADFPRRAFCLYVNGEPVGVSSQYKALWHTRNFLLGELA